MADNAKRAEAHTRVFVLRDIRAKLATLIFNLRRAIRVVTAIRQAAIILVAAIRLVAEAAIVQVSHIFN
jgi:hypothetical protein